MRVLSIMVFLIVWCLHSLTQAWAGQELLAISLSPKVRNRQPVKPFSPPARCEKDQGGEDSIPIVQVPRTRKVYFWTRLASTSWVKVRHSWHHEINGQWEVQSFVDLKVGRSGSYRTWSRRTMAPQRDVGNWMIVVSLSHDPDHILCISRFVVK
ncbi:MAG: DUF2914 domain-containing protein [Nitrospirales bacterium]|nr:DUF2914 domain-containing protein [Nitrospirales bacterium]